MRMWMTDPSGMCSQHLLGEHVELHMLAGTLRRGKSIAGFIRDGLVEPTRMVERHAELVAEMARRGFKHTTPLESPPLGSWAKHRNVVNPAANRAELLRRCPKCYSHPRRARISTTITR